MYHKKKLNTIDHEHCIFYISSMMIFRTKEDYFTKMQLNIYTIIFLATNYQTCYKFF